MKASAPAAKMASRFQLESVSRRSRWIVSLSAAPPSGIAAASCSKNLRRGDTETQRTRLELGPKKSAIGNRKLEILPPCLCDSVVKDSYDSDRSCRSKNRN